MVKDSEHSARESSISSGWTVEGQPESELEAVAQAASRNEPELEVHSGSAPDQLSSGALVLLGLIGGIYLLFTFVWFSWANATATANAALLETSGSLGGVLQQIVLWCAPFAPALWFVSVLVLCRGAKMWRRALWLALGLLLLVPLPMFGGMF